MVAELKITLKNESKEQKTPILEYEEFRLSLDDPILKAHIESARKEFGQEVDKGHLTIRMEL